MKFKINFKHIALLLAIIGPGIITASVDNDASGITTYSVAGASFGYALLWTLIPITLILILVQEMSARMGVVTGKGLADLIRENFGVKVTFFIMIGLLIANIATTVAEYAGIAAAGEIFGINKLILVPICAIVIFFLVIKANYKTLEKVFLVMCLFYVAYIFSGFMAKPDWGQVMTQFITPSFSFGSPYIIMLIAIIGTTVTPWMQFYLQSSIAEKGIKIEEYKYCKIDVITGCLITDIISFFIIVATAATLFTAGIQIESAADAALALQPLAGQYAAALFAFGLFVAGVFGAFILPLSTSFYVCEGMGFESGVNKKFKEAPQFYILLGILILIPALVIMLPNTPLIKIMIASQVINGILLPFVLITMLLLINNKKVMGNYVNSKWYNFIAWSVSAILILLTVVLVITTLFPHLFG